MARWRSHANPQKGNAAARLICHFSKISGKWQAAGNTDSRCRETAARTIRALKRAINLVKQINIYACMCIFVFLHMRQVP